jgi:hypothetical protein
VPTRDIEIERVPGEPGNTNGTSTGNSSSGAVQHGAEQFVWPIGKGSLKPEKRQDAGRFQNGAQGRNRTTDTAIFSRMLYQLSYLGIARPQPATALEAAA